jgi:hypothetical protein
VVEKINLFTSIFLQWLLREIRVLLAKANHKDPKTLVKQADKLWALQDITSGGRGGIFAVQENPKWILWPPSWETDDIEEALPGRRARQRREDDPLGCPSPRLQGRPGWQPVSASSTGGMKTPPLPVRPLAAGRETAVPGATKCCRPRRSTTPHR